MRVVALLVLIVFASNFSYAFNLENVDRFINMFSTEKGYVVSVEGDTLITDLGKNRNTFKGMKINIYKQVKKVVHPITGEVIAESTVKMGEAVVDDVYDKFSYAKIIQKKGEIEEGQYAKIDTPILLNTEYYDIDNVLINDIQKRLESSKLFTFDKNSPYTLKVYSADNYGISVEFTYFNEILAKFYSTDLKVVSAQKELNIKKQNIKSKGYKHISICKLNNSYDTYAVLAESEKVDIYKIGENGNFDFFKSIDKSFNEIISLDCSDLNDNKKDEIFITVSNDGKGVKTFIYEYDNEFKLLKDNLPFIVRSVYINGNKKIIMQRLTRDGKFVGSMNFLIYNGQYIKGETIPYTAGYSIYGFGLGNIDRNNGLEIVKINDKSNMEIYNTDGKLLYTSLENYGDTIESFMMKDTQIENQSETNKEDQVFGESYKILTRHRIFIDKGGEIITIKNANMSSIIGKSFNAVISVNKFENKMLRSLWSSEGFGTNLLDFYFYDTGAKKYIYAIKSEIGGFLSSSNSEVITIELNKFNNN